MRKLCCGSLAAMAGLLLAGLLLAGCVRQSPAVDPAAAVAQLSTGTPLLRCRADCVADWRRAQPDAAQLDAARRWSELAALVITINYQDDLTLYYLARAAEGLGYPTAASSYYRQSTYISGSSLSCRHESGVCGGVVLPDAALARIAALENDPRRARPHPPRQPATGAKSAPAGSKPVPAGEHRPRPPAGLEREPPQSGAGESEPLQPATPISQPRAPAGPVFEQTHSTPSNTGPAPPPPAGPGSPPPARADPVAKQYIEPPAAR